MAHDVRQKADFVGTHRFICVYLMETLSRWVPTTPELEVKALFGRHLWDLAQHADQLGQRTAELRAGLHYNREPSRGCMEILDSFAGTEDTAQRIQGFYDGVLPFLTKDYQAFLDAADPLLDDPTIRILERMVADHPRMLSQRDEVLEDRPDLGSTDSTFADGIRQSLEALEDVVTYRAPVKTAGAAG